MFYFSITDTQGFSHNDLEKIVLYITVGSDFFTRKSLNYC
jgi:hypothetical protein